MTSEHTRRATLADHNPDTHLDVLSSDNSLVSSLPPTSCQQRQRCPGIQVGAHHPQPAVFQAAPAPSLERLGLALLRRWWRESSPRPATEWQRRRRHRHHHHYRHRRHHSRRLSDVGVDRRSNRLAHPAAKKYDDDRGRRLPSGPHQGRLGFRKRRREAVLRDTG